MWFAYVGYLLALSSNVIHAHVDTLTARQEAGCQQACETLASEYPGRLHYESDDTNFTAWDEKQQQTVYLCRVEPASASEVSNIVQVLVDNWCRFAVKCGGHSRYPDDSVSLGGVTIDLDVLNSIVVSDDRTTARVGGGALAHQVYAALVPFGLAYVGGRIGQVGIGGFTLGGGTSPLSAKYGWALDNVVEYEIVLPNATIATVSENQHPDLYYALRGGANNFGIVTSFNVTVFPQGHVYVATRTFGDNQVDRFLEEAERIFTVEDAEDTNVGLEYRYIYSADQNSYTISSTQRYAEPVSNPPVFDAMNAIPALSDLSGSIESLADSTSSTEPMGETRNVFKTLTHYPSIELGKQAVQIFKDTFDPVRNITDLEPAMITYSIPTAAVENMKARGGNALGIDVEGHLVLNLLMLSWTDSTNDDVAYSLADHFIGDFQLAAEGLDVLHPYIYINYADKGQDVFSGYGQENKQRLIAIQEDIDPRGIFTSTGLWRGFFKVR